MKESKEIIGLRIISIVDGTQIGYVKDYVLNAKEGSLDFFIMDQEADYFGAKIIPFSEITGLGEFGLTVPSRDVVQDVAQNNLAQELIKDDVRVISTKVLTKKGQLIGEVLELLIDEETGRIASCMISGTDGEKASIGAESIITFGKELLIIESFTPIKSEPGFLDAVPVAKPAEPVIETVTPQEPETGFNLFEQKQLQYFIGKSVDKDIKLDNGDVLAANEGITEEIIGKITSRATLMEVTSHLNKN